METQDLQNPKYIKSPINFRAFLVIAAAVVGAIFCAYFYMLSRAAIVIGIIYLSALLALSVMFAVKFKRGRIRLCKLVSVIIAFVFSMSAFSLAAAYSDYRLSCLEMSGARQVGGRLCDIDARNGDYVFVLDELTFDGDGVRGKLKLTVAPTQNNNAELLKVGDRVYFFSRVDGVPLVSDMRIDGTSFRTGVIYTCHVKGDALEIHFGEPKPIEKLLSALKDLLTDNMGDRYGNIAYSMITGDKYGLSSEINSSFSAAGLGHILAVSGLHIGFLTFLIGIIFFRANKYIRFAVTALLLSAYVVIADFSPSVIRAAVMAVISGTSVFIGGRRDLLSSLLCAFSCILAFRPIYLFEVGFLMSFGAIFGIAAFAGIISRYLTSHGAHHNIANSIGTAVSVQAGIIPPQAYFFGAVQPLSILINIAVLPYLGLTFIAILVCIPIAAIPNFGAAVGWCKYLLMPIDYITQAVSAIPHFSITVKASCAVFLCYPIMFCMSDFFMMPKSKTVLVICSAILCAALCVI